MNVSPLMLITPIVIGSIAAYLAHKRDRNPYIWFTVGFLFGIFGIFAFFFATQKKVITPIPKERVPVFTIQGPKDKFWYYLDREQKQQGPISHAALASAWKQGNINEATLVWHEELTDWKPLKETLITE